MLLIIAADADGEGYRTVFRGDPASFTGVADILGQLIQFLLTDTVNQEDKFLTPEACDDTVTLFLPHDGGYPADYLIPLHMSEGIIDFLKIINVHHQDANGMSVLQYLLQHSFSILHKGTTIVDTAEVIIAGLIQRILKLQDIVDGDCNVVGEDLQQSLVCSAEVLHLI